MTSLMQRLAVASLAALAASCASVAPSAKTRQPVAEVAQGRVVGRSESGIDVFRGIPYAAAPTGAMRWKPPAPAETWTGLRDAGAFGPSCIQPPVPQTSLYFDPPKSSSEDCLSLNVWAPADAQNAPVIVWIHGGSLRIGGSAQPMYDGRGFAERGIVFVSINYRLGVLGWLAHPELISEDPDGLSGNYGLRDQIAALEWVRDNIAAFGGDATNVTIMGESAGALSVTYLLTSPPAKELFAKSIIQSTNTRNFPTLGSPSFGLPAAEAIGSGLFAKLGLGSISAARAMDAQELTDRATSEGAFTPQGIIDGRYLPAQLNAALDSGAFAKVPVLAGFTSGEFRSYKAFLPKLPATPADYAAEITARMGEQADEFLALYPADDVRESTLAAGRDSLFGWSTERVARRLSEAGQPAFFYIFDYCYPSMRTGDLCAFHASELPFVFDTAADESVFPPAWPKPQQDEAAALSDTLIDYWASFAATGRPFSADGPVWRDFGDDKSYLLIRANPSAETNPNPGMFDLHERHYREKFAGGIGWFSNIGLWAPRRDD